MSYVDIIKAELEKAQSVVLKTTHMSRDEYSALMFNHGTLFAERFASKFLNKDDLLKSLLQNKAYGFWHWWCMKYQLDDAAMIKKEYITYAPYTQMKETMIGDPLFEEDLYYLIKPLLP